MKTFEAWTRDGRHVYGDFTDGVQNYAQQFGPDGPGESSFDMVPENGLTEMSLWSWFEGRFLANVRVYEGSGQIWGGYVGRMRLQVNGAVYEKNVADVANRVKAARTGDDGTTEYWPRWREETTCGVNGEGYWLADAESVAQFGPLERIVRDPVRDAWEAIARAKRELARYGQPGRLDGAMDTPEPRLTVTLIGPQELANRILLNDQFMDIICGDQYGTPDGPDDRVSRLRYTPEHWGVQADFEEPIVRPQGTLSSQLLMRWGSTTGPDGKTWTVSDEIRRICRVVQVAGGPLYARDIDEHDTPTAAGVEQPTGAWDRIRALAELPDEQGRYYALFVDVDGAVDLKRIEDMPIAYRFQNEVILDAATRERPGWAARPGLMEITDRQAARVIGFPGNYLGMDGVQFVERWDMAEGDEFARPGQRERTPSDILAAIDREERWLKRRRKDKRR